MFDPLGYSIHLWVVQLERADNVVRPWYQVCVKTFNRRTRTSDDESDDNDADDTRDIT